MFLTLSCGCPFEVHMVLIFLLLANFFFFSFFLFLFFFSYFCFLFLLMSQTKMPSVFSLAPITKLSSRGLEAPHELITARLEGWV
jgi:hypothetical protein